VALTYTTTGAAKATTPAIPYGWTTTVAVCKHCGPKPTTLTLTKPVKGFYEDKKTYSVSAKDTSVSPAFGEKSKGDGGHANSGPGSAGPDAADSSNSGPGKAGGGGEEGHSSLFAPLPTVTASTPFVATSTGSYPVAAGTGSKTQAAPVSQFTGAASKQTVGFGVLISALISLFWL
jgi:chitinase